MKKPIYLLVSLITVSLLVNCKNGDSGGDMPKTTYYTITLDADGGTFATGPTYSFDVEEGDNLSKNIKRIVGPGFSGKTFAYYTYSDGTAVNYNDVVTSNIE